MNHYKAIFPIPKNNFVFIKHFNDFGIIKINDDSVSSVKENQKIDICIIHEKLDYLDELISFLFKPKIILIEKTYTIEKRLKFLQNIYPNIIIDIEYSGRQVYIVSGINLNVLKMNNGDSYCILLKK